MRHKPQSTFGFTIVELLIVIVVIAILAAISVVAFNGIQQRARDTQRAHDLAALKKALLIYDTQYGGVPKTEAYGGNGYGGWNYSYQPNWLSFLSSSTGKIPIDPTNNASNFPDTDGERAYFYYCYPSSSAVEPNKPTVVIGYISDQTQAQIRSSFIVQSCLTSLPL